MTLAIVAGALANRPGHGGEAWVPISWTLGLRRLGYEVVLAEQISEDSAAARSWFAALMERFGLADSSCLVIGAGPQTDGLPFEDLVARAERAELLVNLSGHLTLEPLMRAVGTRLFVDLDPGYTQLWASQGLAGARLDGHDHFASVGLNLGQAGCSLPTAGRSWIPTLPPVLLEEWDAGAAPGGSFTTVASWRNALGTINHGGTVYGSKAHRFRPLASLPARVGADFELALAIDAADDADRRLLTENGWGLREPRRAAGDPDAFRAYLAGSLAEFSVAQPLYVDTASGWFSDRSAHYLASGRPVLVEETGLAGVLPVGEGLLTFGSLEQAEAGARAILAEPERHRAAARALAASRFSSDLVLTDLMAQIGVAP
jgi:hypothetical protein